MMRIELKDVVRIFGDKEALAGVSCTFPFSAPETIGLVGPNGAGKTTLLKIAAGLLLPSAGEAICIDGDRRRNVDAPEVRTHIAFVLPGDRNLFFRNTVLENIAYSAAIRNQDPGGIKEKIGYYAQRLNMSHLLKNQVGNLSTGERKKASILAGLCTNTKLLIMDEPSNGLDIDSVLELQNIIKDIRQCGDMTVVVSSHDVNMLSGMATKYIYIRSGQIVLEKGGEMEPEEIIGAYKNLMQEVQQ